MKALFNVGDRIKFEGIIYEITEIHDDKIYDVFAVDLNGFDRGESVTSISVTCQDRFIPVQKKIQIDLEKFLESWFKARKVMSDNECSFVQTALKDQGLYYDWDEGKIKPL